MICFKSQTYKRRKNTVKKTRDFEFVKTTLTSLVLSGIVIGNAYANSPNPMKYSNEYKNHIHSQCPIQTDSIRNFVYFARDRDSVRNHAFLTNNRFQGAQIMYSWAELEKEYGKYDFSKIKSDIDYLAKYGKKLFIQLQGTTFMPNNKATPSYLSVPEFGGGSTPQYDDSGKREGWVARYWEPKVQERFSKLIEALGKEFDGKIEGINLQETAIGVNAKTDKKFTPKLYVQSVMKNMDALRNAFHKSIKLQYANFMPGEWLPWEDKGYLKSLYEYGEKIGVGLGTPDLMMRRKGQLNHAFTMMHEHQYTVPLAIAIQDGNYIGKTNDLSVPDQRKNLVPALHSFAKKFLDVDYIFWGNQKPYFDEFVLPCYPNS